ncbi:hypothetical protein D9M71_842750 [compost metagenome]
MAAIVVVLDVLKIHRLGNTRPLINLAQPVRQVRIIRNPPQVAFEVPVIHRVKADQRGKQANVRFSQVFAHQITIGV